MALTAGSTPAPTGNKGLLSPRRVVAMTRVQNGIMTKRPTPARKQLAKAAAASPHVSPYQTQAQAEIDPIIAAITAAATGQANAADKAIQGLTNSYAQGISGIDYGAPYSGAEAQQAAVDAALQQSATGQGSDLAAALSQRLQALQGSSGANAVNQEAAALANQGAGIGGAQLASGSAALNQLISDAAAAKEYGAKMPGIVRESGLQGVAQAQGQAQQAINQGTLQAESQLPSIEQTLKADKLQAQATKADTAYKNAEIGLKAQSLKSENAYRGAEVGLRQQSLAQGQQRLQIEATKAAQSALNSNRNYSLSLSRLGIENKRLQLSALTQSTKLANGGFTPDELVKLRGDASQVISAGKSKGYTRAQVLNNLIANGIPLNLVGNQLKVGGYGKPVKIPTPKIKLNAMGLVASPAGDSLPLGVKGAKALAEIKNPRERKQATTIVTLAHQYLGTPYVWGGESPKGFDCSGFAQYLYGNAGIKIPRTTYTQWQTGHAVQPSDLVPGDLVFFKGSDSRGGLPGHVGIYIGGDKMIDAPHTGASVRIESVSTFGGYMGARRY